MKKLWHICILFFLSIAHAHEPLPSTAREAFANHLKTVKKFVQDNERELKITGSSLKVLGAICLLKGNFTLLKNLAMIRPFSQKAGFFSKILYPIVSFDDTSSWDGQIIDYKSVAHGPIARPPYFTALFIAAYLLYTGSSELYHEINTLIKEYKKNNSSSATSEEKSPIVFPHEKESLSSASDTIAHQEMKNHLQKPDDKNSVNRPRLHPYKPTS
jgi:hypothetical protein